MNKILKIIVKHDPIFKYIVEDYPFYEGIFFHSIDYQRMNIIKTHYLLRQKLNINEGKLQFLCNRKYFMRLIPKINIYPPKFLINPKFRIKSRAKFYIFNLSKNYIHLNLRLKMNDKNYSKSTVNLHMIKLTRLKTHDPYTLESRDTLSLSAMDGEKIL